MAKKGPQKFDKKRAAVTADEKKLQKSRRFASVFPKKQFLEKIVKRAICKSF